MDPSGIRLHGVTSLPGSFADSPRDGHGACVSSQPEQIQLRIFGVGVSEMLGIPPVIFSVKEVVE